MAAEVEADLAEVEVVEAAAAAMMEAAEEENDPTVEAIAVDTTTRGQDFRQISTRRT